MFNYYKKAIINLLNEVHEARKEPFSNIIKWRGIQEKLIKKIIAAENNIRKRKKETNSIKSTRKNPLKKLTKEESESTILKLKKNEYQIDEYKRLIDIY